MSEQKTNKGWNNLQGKRYSFANMDREKHLEISRRGAEQSHKVAKERRTAKKCLEDILTLECTEDIISGANIDPLLAEQLKQYADKITMYDLLMLVSVGLGVGGNVRALEFVRDSVGDMPVKQLNIDSNATTPEDRELLETISKRLNDPDITIDLIL